LKSCWPNILPEVLVLRTINTALLAMRTVHNTKNADVETLTSSPDRDLLVFLKKKYLWLCVTSNYLRQCVDDNGPTSSVFGEQLSAFFLIFVSW